MKVTYFHRKPRSNNFSIERLFEDVCEAMPDEIESEVCVNRFSSNGFFRRLYDTLRATLFQGDINHVTGDVHYVTYLLSRHKTILTVHDCVSLNRLKGIRYSIFKFLWYWLPLRRCAVVTTISNATKNELANHLKMKGIKIKIVPDCVSPEFLPFLKDFNSESPKILQVGTGPNKNLERVTKALKGIDCRLVIIGQLSDGQIITLNQNKIDYENYSGISRHKLVVHYQNADIVMFASLYEGFGLPILEANGVGRAVITSNLYSMPEVGGEAACYVDPYNVLDIRNAVEKIINNSNYRNQLVENGFTNVKRFQASIIAAKYAELYRSILYN